MVILNGMVASLWVWFDGMNALHGEARCGEMGFFFTVAAAEKGDEFLSIHACAGA